MSYQGLEKCCRKRGCVALQSYSLNAVAAPRPHRSGCGVAKSEVGCCLAVLQPERCSYTQATPFRVWCCRARSLDIAVLQPERCSYTQATPFRVWCCQARSLDIGGLQPERCSCTQATPFRVWCCQARSLDIAVLQPERCSCTQATPFRVWCCKKRGGVLPCSPTA